MKKDAWKACMHGGNSRRIASAFDPFGPTLTILSYLVSKVAYSTSSNRLKISIFCSIETGCSALEMLCAFLFFFWSCNSKVLRVLSLDASPGVQAGLFFLCFHCLPPKPSNRSLGKFGCQGPVTSTPL